MSEKQEGKLKHDILASKYQDSTIPVLPNEPIAEVVNTNKIIRVIDEMKADLPFNVYFDNQIGGENHYSFCKPGGEQIEDIDEITRDIAEWLEKWIYGLHPKNGLYLVNKETNDP
jgi:hypothetical protein